jgi:protein TonB
VGIASGGGHGIGGGVGATPASAPSRMRTSPLPASAPTVPPPPPPKQEKDQKRKDRVEKGGLIEAPHPVYPAEARREEIQGTVVVRITIDQQGNVISARPKSGPEALRQASLDAAYKARFEPAMKDGKPVQVEAALAYNFVMTRQ